MNFNRLFSTLFLVAALGCSPGGGNDSPKQDQTVPPPETPDAFDKLVVTENKWPPVSKAERLGAAFSIMEARCPLAGGEFHDLTKTCRCPVLDNGWPTFFTTKETEDQHNQGQCYPARPLHQSKDIYPTFEDMVQRSGPQNFYFSIKNQINRSIDSEFVINLKKSKEKDKEYMMGIAKSFDKGDAYVYFAPNFGTAWPAQTILHLDRTKEDTPEAFTPQAVKDLAKVWDRYKRSKEDNTRFTFNLYAKNAISVAGLMGLPPGKRYGLKFPDVPKDHPNLEQLERLDIATGVLDLYYAGIGMSVTFEDDVRILSEGCHLRCIVTTKFTLEDYSYRFERMYLHGTVVYSRLMEYTGDLMVAGMSYSSMAVFGYGETVSTVILNKRNTQSLNPKWEVTMLDETLKEAAKFSEELPLDQSAVASLAQPDSAEQADAATVAILASGIDTRDAELMKWLKVGPHRSTSYLAGGSLFGWWQTEPGDKLGYNYSQFYDGVFDNGYKTIPEQDNYTNHLARHVVGFPDDVGEVTFVPFSHERWLTREGQLYQKIKQTGAKVVLVPFFKQVDGKSSCPKNDVFLDPNYLFIIQTGYDGKNNPADACLGNLRGKSHRIVVASNYRGPNSVAPWSDSGENFSDLVEYSGGETGMEGGEGLSFSAAKVAHTAAVIFKRFGHKLTPALVRMAILLSVKASPETPNSTRTGGKHDHDQALKAAQYMVDVLEGRIDISDARARGSQMMKIVAIAGGLGDDIQLEKQIELLLKNNI